MRHKNRDSLILTALLTALVALFVVAASGYVRGVRLVPLVVGVPTLILLLLLLLGEFRPSLMQVMEKVIDSTWGGGKTATPGQEDSRNAPPWSAVLRILGWTSGFFAALFLFGYYLIPVVFTTAFLIGEAGVKFFRAAILSLSIGVVLYSGLALLKVDLWTGAIPEIIPGYLGGSIIPPL